MDELKPIIEAMIFVSSESLTEKMILEALAESGADKERIRACITEIEKEWNENEARGVGLVQVAGGYQFRTKPKFVDWLKKLSVPKPMRLSGPALETLAIVAYRQPIVRSEVERIRGVDSGAVLKTLLERRLLRIVGRQDEPGQPLLYGTTKDFLEIFNLKGLTELPTLKDIEELMRERRTVTLDSPDKNITTISEEGEELTQEIAEEKELEENIEEENKDMETLTTLEQSMKDLRRLERSIFPREMRAGNEECVLEGGQDASGGEVFAPQAGSADAGEDENSPDAPAEDDSPI